MRKKIAILMIYYIVLNQFIFSSDYSRFQKDGLYGLITNDRGIVLKPSYDWIDIGNNSIVCSRKHFIEIYNTSLELLYSDSKINLLDYTEDDILITDPLTADQKLLNVKTGYIKEYHRDERYLEEHGYRDNLELVWESKKKDFLYSIVDSKGNILLSDIEQSHSFYTNGMLAIIMIDGKSGFVNTQGKIVIETDFYINKADLGPRKYPSIPYAFSEGYALVKTKDQKWIQFNIKGNKKILPDNIEPVDLYYKNGLVLIRDKETKKLGYMNPKFKIVIPCKFDEADSFVGKYAVVKVEGKDAIIDKKGNIYFSEDLR